MAADVGSLDGKAELEKGRVSGAEHRSGRTVETRQTLFAIMLSAGSIVDQEHQATMQFIRIVARERRADPSAPLTANILHTIFYIHYLLLFHIIFDYTDSFSRSFHAIIFYYIFKKNGLLYELFYF